ncbi:MAG: hypothetical protein WAN50_05470 [Minisyncoccia bacterium]
MKDSYVAFVDLSDELKDKEQAIRSSLKALAEELAIRPVPEPTLFSSQEMKVSVNSVHKVQQTQPQDRRSVSVVRNKPGVTLDRNEWIDKIRHTWSDRCEHRVSRACFECTRNRESLLIEKLEQVLTRGEGSQRERLDKT